MISVTSLHHRTLTIKFLPAFLIFPDICAEDYADVTQHNRTSVSYSGLRCVIRRRCLLKSCFQHFLQRPRLLHAQKQAKRLQHIMPTFATVQSAQLMNKRQTDIHEKTSSTLKERERTSKRARAKT